MNIFIIGATHGNEILGVKVYEQLLRTCSPLLEQVTFILGNPRAYAQRKRYTEKDLNRSYGSIDQTYESRRAQYIVNRIEQERPDIVIDMHTTTATQPSCLIVSNLRGKAKKVFLRASHISYVMKVRSLADICSAATNVVGYEVSESSITTELIDEIIHDLQRYVDGHSYSSNKLLYTMCDKILRSEVSSLDIQHLKNFEMSHLGYVPVMVGEDSYQELTDYIGFKVSKEKHITV